jgi:N4-gp56 family major capsid protein
VAEYQDFITVSTFLVETIIDPVVTNASELLGYSAGLSVDTITRVAIDAATSAILSPGTLGPAASVNDLRRCKTILEASDVPPKDDDYYYCVLHPYILYDIKSDNTAGGFIDLMKFADPSVFLKPANEFNGAIGVVDNIKIWASTNVNTTGSAPNVLYYGYVFGRGGVGAVDLMGSGPTKVEDPTMQQFKINVIRGGPQIVDPSGMIGAAVSYRYVYLSVLLDTTNYRFRIFKADASLV